jgi:UDP:flavonoid glycosyltransferase YjiC (YdhE family)
MSMGAEGALHGMARILITTFGTAGDLNPFVALGLGLKARGHTVSFAVEDAFHPTLLDAGFGVVHRLPSSVEPSVAFSDRDLYRSSLPFRSVRALMAEYVVPTLLEKVEALKVASAGADLIVAPSEQFAASIVSELTGIPWASVNLSPVSIPSVHVKPHPWPASLPAPLQRLANRAQWGVASMALRFMADGPINAIRAQYGLPRRRNLLTAGNLSPSLAAIAVSPAFMPVQPDWPPHLRVSGFCFWDTPVGWSERADSSLQRSCCASAPDDGCRAACIRLAAL